MKKVTIAILMIAFVSFSCDKDDGFSPVHAIQGEWDMVKANYGLTGDFSASELNFKEQYVFHSDGSFVKKYEGEDETFQISGTYTYREAEVSDSSKARVYLTLSYTNEANRKWMCSEEREDFVLTHAGELFKSCRELADFPVYYFDKK